MYSNTHKEWDFNEDLKLIKYKEMKTKFGRLLWV